MDQQPMIAKNGVQKTDPCRTLDWVTLDWVTPDWEINYRLRAGHFQKNSEWLALQRIALKSSSQCCPKSSSL
jgi:hypothetical protein